MSWTRGSDLFHEISESLVENIADPIDRKRIYYDIIRIFEDYDCDTLYELLDVRSMDRAFKEAYLELNPNDDPSELDDFFEDME